MAQHILDALHASIIKNQIKGFLAQEEAEALFYLAKEFGALAPCLEIGSYCGKSSVYLGKACEEVGSTLFTVDHHRGSEEHQIGEEYHDPDFFDEKNQVVDTFPSLRRTLELFQLQEVVVPIVARSQTVVKNWNMPLGMVFIDGGHSLEQAMFDCLNWSKQVIKNGALVIHDIFPNPEEGGQAPYLAMQAVLNLGEFSFRAKIQSLVILEKNA